MTNKFNKFTKSDALQNALNCLEKDGASNALLQWFETAFIEWQSNNNHTQNLDLVTPVNQSEIDHVNSSDLFDCTEYGQQYVSQCVSIKLNGGLGTSMGCSGAKSLVKINQSHSKNS